MKTTSQLYHQNQRIYRKLRDRTGDRIKLVDPATDGIFCQVTNWGNDEARAILKLHHEKTNDILLTYCRLHSVIEHEQHHHSGFFPMWCEHCNA